MIESADFAEQRWIRLVADDDSQEPICRYFQQTSAIIADSIRNKKACLVHCTADTCVSTSILSNGRDGTAGMSRSICLIAAYLISNENMSVDLAIRYIKNRRAFAQPNSIFMIQLMEWEKAEQGSATTVRP